jgi:hypothetical protein
LLGCLEFIIPHEQKLIFADFVAASLLIGGHRLTCDDINKLLTEAVARLLIDLPERDAPFPGDGRIQRDRAGNERELQKALPVRAGNQGNTPTEPTWALLKWVFRPAFLSPDLADMTPSSELERRPHSSVIREQTSNRASPDDWMTGAPASYLKTLEQLGEQDEFSQNLTKAEASRRIGALKSKLGRKRTAEARHRKNQARLTRMAEGVRESSL